MALDRYALCPGGTGKKIKFCCADLTTELEHIQRSLEGEQRLAALDRVRKARAQHGDRACLLAIECLLEDDLDQVDQHAATLATFTEKFPENPVTLAETALTRADRDGPQAGVEPLQRAIAAATQHMPGRVFEAISILGRLLVGRGLILAGRAHLLLELALSGGRSESTLTLLGRLSRADEVPLLIKDDHHLKPVPDGFAAVKGFQEALQLANRGAWLAAAQRFEQFAAVAAGVPEVWHNLGLLKAYIADQDGATAALHKLATLAIPEDDAVEAEALAQLLATVSENEMVDVVAATWSVGDAADVQTRLGGADRVLPIPFDPASLAGNGEPPPLALFRLTDRATPPSSESLTRETVPTVLGQVALFGRQTDREARVELIATRGVEFDSARDVLSQIISQPLGFPEKEEVVRRVSPMQQALTWRWHLPADITAQQRSELTRQQHRHVIVELWPTLPNPALQGKTAREAAADPASRIPLSAAVLNLELASSRVGNDQVIAELRQQLGLPAPAMIDPTGLDVELLPAPRLARIEVAKLSDDDLIALYRRAAWLHFVPAIERLAAEVIRRPSLDHVPDKADKAEAYGLLAEIAEDPAERLKHIAAAREVAESRGESSAPWDLSELAVSLERADNENFQRLLSHIRDNHLQEPGVGEALMNLLAQAGLVPTGGQGMPPGMAMAGGPGGPAAPSAAAAGKISDPWRRRGPSRRQEVGYLDPRKYVTRDPSTIERQHMARALELAVRGQGRVEPNPMVGCVIVGADGTFLGEGWHTAFGQPHAEVEALAIAGAAARGGTMFVTLEPCCHHGKTPPCTDAILAAGLKRVVVAMRDPFAQVAGQGLAALKQAGIKTDVGLLEEEAQRLNAPYLKLLRSGRPWVIAKWAMTLDGKLATVARTSRWISGEASRAMAHQIRGRVDAIVVGRGTAEADDPLLTARPPGPRVAARIVLDSQANLAPDSQLVRTVKDAPVIVAASTAADTTRVGRLEQLGCEVWLLPGGTPAVRVEALLDELGRRRMTNLLVEGGAELLGSFFDARAVDEASVFVAPRVIGGATAPSPVAGRGLSDMADALGLAEVTVEHLAEDIWIRGRVVHAVAER